MTTAMTDFQLQEAALSLVLGTLAFDRAFMERLSPTDIPVMLDDGRIFGCAVDNAAIFEEYPANWTGLAIKCSAGSMKYWFIYNTDQFGAERAFACLGEQPSICAAIVAAVHSVRSDLKHWGESSLAA